MTSPYFWALLGTASFALACSGENVDTSTGAGGSAGESAGGSGGSMAAGGSGGDAGGTGGSGGAGGDEELACSDRTDGALIEFAVVAETVSLWITDDVFIDEAVDQLAGNVVPRVPMFNGLQDERDCDPQWTWHVNPAMASFADFAIELCDGLPSHIEDDKTYWLQTVMSYCPWNAQVTAVDDRRD